jgi:hypothetical protein
MTITYHPEVIQGSDEWAAMRVGLLTASEINRIVTPTGKTAANAASRAHVWEIAAQRITGHVEPTYIGDEMLRGHEDEILARALYSEKYAPVTECGFVTNDEWGFTIGCSPDGLVGDDGAIECKSRRQRFQIEAIVTGEVPDEHVLQPQTILLVTRRKWIDYVSYSGGLPMKPIMVEPDEKVQAAIIEAATAFEARVAEIVALYGAASKGLPPTERRVEQEMFV